MLTGMNIFVGIKFRKYVVCRLLKRPSIFVPTVSSNYIDQHNSTKQWFHSPFGSFPPSQYSNNCQCLSAYTVIIASDKIKTMTKRDQCTSICVYCVNVSTCPGCPAAPFCHTVPKQHIFQLLVFFCSSVPVVLFGTPGISGYRSQHVPVESSSLIYLFPVVIH